tara:strand:+ start:154 stop:579 length:426 start_codon:yes stop_codon:yes gene_type:complete
MVRKIEPIKMKDEYKSLLKGIVYIIVVISTIKLFSTGFITTWLILLGFNIIYLRYTNSLTFPTFLKNGLLLAGLLGLFMLLAPFGLTGWIIGTLGICGFILYSRREKFMQIKHHGETMIWGKPLKEFIKEGKKPPKIKITR